MSQGEWGAKPLYDGRWCFGLWAPDAGEVHLELGDDRHGAQALPGGWWQVEAPGEAGDVYCWSLDGTCYPDPAAFAQAGDVHGASRLVDHGAYAWQHPWPGRAWHEAVVYELHIGTFTKQGTFAAAAAALPRLARLGVTFIEIMPVAQFNGARGWGYDGVLPFAPHPAYGTPDDLRALVDAAHGLGIGVLLDVVYNHFGPSGNYLAAWCPSFFHADRASPWGQGIAFEQEAVRRYFIANALHWLADYRMDGLRLDAVHAIGDASPGHFLDELGAAIRTAFAGRQVHLVTEDERNLARYFEPEAPYDATWNDDWHHAIHCLLTGEDESYYAPFARDPVGDLATALADGYVEQGQARPGGEGGDGEAPCGEPPRGEPPRGEPSAHLPRSAFVNFLGNHDQVGNRARGERLHHLVEDAHALRVVTALTLLAPFVPMLFMGDEFLTEAPFLFFADFGGELGEAVRKGRAREFAKFSAFGGEVPDPIARETFEASRIGGAETQAQKAHEAFVGDLIALRRDHVVPLLAASSQPICAVERDGDFLAATWTFATQKLGIAVRLGSEGPEPARREQAFLDLRAQASPFVFSAFVEAAGEVGGCA